MSRSIAGLTVDRVESILLDAAPEIRTLQRGGGGSDAEASGTDAAVADVTAADAAAAESTATGPAATDAAGRNPSGDQRIAADAAADELLVERLAAVGGVGQVASEERAEVLDAGDGLAVTVDPLDGSSNLASNNPTGTIVGVYDAALPARGRDLVAAGFVVYGPRTTVTFAREGTATVHELADGSRRVLESALELPDEPTVVGIGGGDDDWPEPVAAVADDLRDELKLRYGGALVADVSQVLTYGGVFGYPQLCSNPHGKLRHQFEVNPIAYVVESAGGDSTDGARSVLERPPSGLHARAPAFVGNESLIERIEARLGTPRGAAGATPTETEPWS